jgi:hypothetical protein
VEEYIGGSVPVRVLRDVVFLIERRNPQATANLSIERALSSFDVRHNLVTSFVWLLRGPQQSRLARAVLGGGQLSVTSAMHRDSEMYWFANGSRFNCASMLSI